MRKRNRIYFDEKGKVVNPFKKEKANTESESLRDEYDDKNSENNDLSADETKQLMRKRYDDFDEEAAIMRALKNGNGDLYGF